MYRWYFSLKYDIFCSGLILLALIIPALVTVFTNETYPVFEKPTNFKRLDLDKFLGELRTSYKLAF